MQRIQVLPEFTLDELLVGITAEPEGEVEWGKPIEKNLNPSGELSLSILAWFTHLAKALVVKPISRATWVTDLPDCSTILTASAFCSAINVRFFFVSFVHSP